MSKLKQKVDEAAKYVGTKCDLVPRYAIVLGTGLDGFASQIDIKARIPYREIPHFPHTTLEHHSGNLILGHVEGRPVVVMEGRLHYYEGHSMEEITLPVRVMRALGAEVLMITTAAGAMNPMHDKGDVMIVEDHINLMGVNPLIGANDDELGPRYPDMCEPYSRELITLAGKIAIEENVRAHRGIYVAVAGPNLETRAEYRFLRTIGADAVGMSTVPEVLVGVHGGMKILAFVVLTDMCLPDALRPANIEEIVKTAREVEPKLTRVVKRVIAEY